MAHRRFVLVVTDARGRHRGRFTLSTAILTRALGACAVAALVLALALVHGYSALQQVRRGRGLEARNAAMATLADTLTQQSHKLALVRDEDMRALTLLSRKSHTAIPAPVMDQVGDEQALLQAEKPDLQALAEETGPEPTAWHDPSVSEALMTRTDALLAQSHDIEGALADLLEYWRDAEQRLTATPSIRPARSPWTTSSYGVRIDPIFHYWVMHKGLDLGGFVGMLVYAPADGIVIWTGTRGGYGQVVVVDHGMGLQTHYAHLSAYMVHKGDVVHRGDPIARMGSTGKSTGPHLHYEVRQDGVPMDPRQFILD